MSLSRLAAVAATGLVVFTGSLGGCEEGRGQTEPGVGATEVAEQEIQARIGDLVIADASVRGGVEGDVAERAVERGEVQVLMTIVNEGDADDTLVAVSSPLAGEVALLSADEEPAEGIEVPAGETVVLNEGGPYVRFDDVEEELGQDDTVSVTLEFAEAGSVDLDVPVGSEAVGGESASPSGSSSESPTGPSAGSGSPSASPS